MVTDDFTYEIPWSIIYGLYVITYSQLNTMAHDHIIREERKNLVAEGDTLSKNGYSTDMLLEELRVIYERLAENGISREIAQQMLWERENVSRVLILPNYRILLADFGIEIKLSPLQWSLYVLFMKHEEGIAYKQMPDYDKELMDIMLSQCKDDALVNINRIKKMIDRLTDPTQSAIRETVSKIRRIFCNATNSNDTAKHYYIYGRRNELHRIALSREFVYYEY